MCNTNIDLDHIKRVVYVFFQKSFLHTALYKFVTIENKLCRVRCCKGLNDIIDRCRDIIQHELCHMRVPTYLTPLCLPSAATDTCATRIRQTTR